MGRCTAFTQLKFEQGPRFKFWWTLVHNRIPREVRGRQTKCETLPRFFYTHTPLPSDTRESRVNSCSWTKFSEPGVQRGGNFPKQILLSVSLASADAATAGARSSLVEWELMSGAACRPHSVSRALLFVGATGYARHQQLLWPDGLLRRLF